MTIRRSSALIVFFASCLIALQFTGAAPPAKQAPAGRTPPDLVSLSYGPDKLNVLDLWKAKADHPTPLLMYIHGGGFSAGRKESVHPALLAGCLKAGISVATVNYRLSPDVSFPTHFMDCARALQFLRANAKEYNLDPTRIALSGSSAGAGTSLWIGFHDDLADPKNSDPVLHESTRVVCIAVMQAQTTYDPRTIRKIISESAANHPALTGFYGLKAEELDTPKAHELYEKASPINYLNTGDPPVFAFYAGERNAPPPSTGKAGEGIHHINFGTYLKERMDKLGIECIIVARDDRGDPIEQMTSFLVKHLKP